MQVTRQQAQVAGLAARAAAQQTAPVHRKALCAAVRLDRIQRRVHLGAVQLRARLIQRIVQGAHVPDVNLARLGPRRDRIRVEARLKVRRRRSRWSCTHAVYTAKVRNRAVFEHRILIDIIVVIVVVIVRARCG